MEMDQKAGTSGTREVSPHLIIGYVWSLGHIYCDEPILSEQATLLTYLPPALQRKW